MNSLSGLSIHCYPELEGHELFVHELYMYENMSHYDFIVSKDLQNQCILVSMIFFLNQPHQEHVSILLVGSVNVKLAS